MRIVVVSLLVAGLFAGCSTPGPAPVTSRETIKSPPASTWQQIHWVRKGETLYSISWQHGLDFHNVAKWNGIPPPYNIYPGQRVRLIPPKQTAQIASPPQKQSPTKSKPPPVAQSRRHSTGQSPQRNKRPVAPRPSPKSKKKSVAKAEALRWRWPVKGRVASGFVPGDPARKGIDIAGRLGQAVVASEAGRVVYAGNGLIGYGTLIILKHNKNYLSAYGYNRRLLVKEGDKVKRGGRLAEMGKDIHGKPRLHFEIRRNGTPVNPLKLLPRNRR